MNLTRNQINYSLRSKNHSIPPSFLPHLPLPAGHFSPPPLISALFVRPERPRLFNFAIGMFLQSFTLFLLLLGLLSAIDKQLQDRLKGIIDYKIELDRCKEDTVCFLRGSCIKEGSTPGSANELVQYKENSATSTLNENCDVIMQIKPFTVSKFFVMIQVKSDSEPIENGAVTLEQGEVQFECKKGADPSGAAYLQFYKISNQKNIHDNTLVFCSFTMRTIDETTIESKFIGNQFFPTIKFKTATEQKIAFAKNAEHLYVEAASKASCDPNLINTWTGRHAKGIYIYEIDYTRTSFSSFSCPGGNLFFEMGKGDPLLFYPSKMECIKNDQNPSFVWKYDDATTQGTIIPPQKHFNIHCVVHQSMLCRQSFTFEDSCSDGSKPVTTIVQKGYPITDHKEIECPNDMWKRNGELFKGRVECHQLWERESDFALFWSDKYKTSVAEKGGTKFATLTLDVGVIATSFGKILSCSLKLPYVATTSQGIKSQTFDFDSSTGFYMAVRDIEKTVPEGEIMSCGKLTCAEYSHLKIDTGVTTTGNSMSCPDGPYLIQTSQGISSTSFVCDESTGLYMNGNQIVPRGEKISCRKLTCSEYSDLTIDTGVWTIANSMSCSFGPTSQGISSSSFVCDESTGLYKNREKVIPKGEKISCRKGDCAEYSDLTIAEGVKRDGNGLSCTLNGPYVLTTSQGISSSSFVCDESTGLYKNGDKIIPKGEKISCRKLDCSEYSVLTIQEGVKMDVNGFSCSLNGPYVLTTSQGISSSSFVCDESTGLYKNGEKIVPKGEKISCKKLTCSEYSDLTIDTGVKTTGNSMSCSDGPYLIQTSQGISSISFVCDESTGLYKNGEKIVPKGEKISCKKLDCSEYSDLTIQEGVKTDGNGFSCSLNGPYILTTSQGISSTSFVCDESTGLYKNGEKIVPKGEKISCRKLTCSEYSDVTINTGVKTTANSMSCPDGPYLIQTSQGISSTSFVCDESTGLYKNGEKIVPKGEKISCRKLDCGEYSGLTIDEGVKTDGNGFSCSLNGPYVLTTSQGISSTSFVCDESTGLYKNGDKIIPKGEKISCKKLGCSEYSTLILGEGVTTNGRILTCSDSQFIIKTSQGISSTSFVCDEFTGLYKNGDKIIPKGEKISCKKLGCSEYSTLILGEGVTTNGRILTCSDSQFIIKTSQGISSTSFVCDESTGLYKNGDKNVPKGEKLTCEKDSTFDAPKGNEADESTGIAYIILCVLGLILIGIIMIGCVIFWLRECGTWAPTSEIKESIVIEVVQTKEAPSSGPPQTPVSSGATSEPPTPKTE